MTAREDPVDGAVDEARDEEVPLRVEREVVEAQADVRDRLDVTGRRVDADHAVDVERVEATVGVELHRR
jgi:hypothetical protein